MGRMGEEKGEGWGRMGEEDEGRMRRRMGRRMRRRMGEEDGEEIVCGVCCKGWT